MQSEHLNKRAIIAEYLTEEVSYRQLQYKYGVSYGTIRRWVLEYQNTSNPLSKERNQLPPADPSEDLPTDVKQLQEELRKARLHNQLLNAMIDIAEEQLNIDIRKKSGSKRSKK